MRIVGRWLRLGAVMCAVGLVAAGCSDADGDTEPTAGPTPELSATTEPEPAPTASATEPAPGPTGWPEPVRPAAMERDDIEGAKAAAEYFLALFTYVHITGDLDSWNEISHPECTFCASVAAEVEQLHASGGYATGPVLNVTEMESAPPDSEYEYYSVWIDAEEAPSARYDESGTVVETFEAAKLEVDLAVTRDADGWVVRGVIGRETGAEDPDA